MEGSGQSCPGDVATARAQTAREADTRRSNGGRFRLRDTTKGSTFRMAERSGMGTDERTHETMRLLHGLAAALGPPLLGEQAEAHRV